MTALPKSRSSAAEIGPAYLIAGTDAAKIDAVLTRLRGRVDGEGGTGSLEVFAASGPSGAPDAEALAAAVPTMSLIAGRRYLLADGVERWSAKQAEPVIAALAALPGETTVVLVAREAPPKLKAPKRLADAVAAAGGELLTYAAPKARQLPGWLREEARRRGFSLDADAASLLVERLGEGTTRLATELDRLAVWSEPGGAVTREDLDAMIADTSEEVSWALSDAIIDRDPAAALSAAERLAGQGEAVGALIYGVAKRLREAARAIDGLEAGEPPQQVEAGLPMHPYAAKLLVRRVRECSPREVRAAACAIADLEWWTRGGADYPEPVALTLAVRRACGVRQQWGGGGPRSGAVRRRLRPAELLRQRRCGRRGPSYEHLHLHAGRPSGSPCRFARRAACARRRWRARHRRRPARAGENGS